MRSGPPETAAAGKVRSVESLLVITNNEAGSADEHNVRRAVDVLRAGADVQVHRTSMPGDLDGILHRRGGRTVVVAGGDGSLHTVVSALHRRNELDRTCLGLVPLGTANDFAHAIGLPLDPAAAAQVILSGAERRRDLLVDCRGNVVVHRVRIVAGRQSKRSLIGSQRSALRVRVEAHAHGETSVLTDFDRPVSWIQVSNGTADTAGTAVDEKTAEDATPSAHVTMAFAHTRLGGAAQVVTNVVDGALRRDRSEPPIRVESVKVAGQRFFLNADGEIEGPEQIRTWMVAPARLRLISAA